MILTENEKQFVELFYKGIYKPEFLFDDKSIIERIIEHPMAIWKINNLT